MYAIRELLATLIFAAIAFAAIFIPFLILSCLYAAGQSWSVRNAKLLFATGAAIRLWFAFMRDAARRAGQTIHVASLFAWLR
jgi:hypothetical protein